MLSVRLVAAYQGYNVRLWNVPGPSATRLRVGWVAVDVASVDVDVNFLVLVLMIVEGYQTILQHPYG
jgi:hypothetical protein